MNNQQLKRANELRNQKKRLEGEREAWASVISVPGIHLMARNGHSPLVKNRVTDGDTSTSFNGLPSAEFINVDMLRAQVLVEIDRQLTVINEEFKSL